VLCTALAEIHQGREEEYDAKAGGFLSQMEKSYMFFGLTLTFDIFGRRAAITFSVR
jgi:hypothetical protein